MSENQQEDQSFEQPPEAQQDQTPEEGDQQLRQSYKSEQDNAQIKQMQQIQENEENDEEKNNADEEQRSEGKSDDKNEEKANERNEESERSPPNNSQIKQQQEEQQQDNSDYQEESIYSQHNKSILKTFVAKYRDQLFNYFKDFSREPEGDALISANDIPLVMRVGFYIDNITFHENKVEQDEFFNKPNSYKKLMTYLVRFLKKSNRDTDIMTAKFNFNEFLNFVDYFISQDRDIFLRHSDEQQAAANQQGNQTYNKENIIENEIRNNITKYENILQECQNENEKKILTSTIEGLRRQLNELIKTQQAAQKNQQSINVSVLSSKSMMFTKEQMRDRSLQEIFNFYTRQQYVQGHQYTFDRIVHESNVLNLAKFMLFCKQFSIQNTNKYLTKKQLPILFKKTAANYKELNIFEFKIILEKIALIMYNDKEYENYNDSQKAELLFKFIYLDDPDQYRKKFALIKPPFSIREKEGFRLLPKDVGRSIKVHQIDQETKEQIQKRKEEEKNRLLTQGTAGIQDDMSRLNSGLRKKQQSQPNLSMLKLKGQKDIQGSHNYAQLQQKNLNSQINLNAKVSWQQLEKITFSDMKQLQGSNFKPTDLFDQIEDQDDKYYLAEYDLQQEKKNKKQMQEQNKIGLEKYGIIKDTLRPTQKYLQKQQNSNYNQLNYVPNGQHRYNHSDDEIDLTPPKMYSIGSSASVKHSLGNKIMIRAQQLDNDIKKKEQEYMNMMNQQQQLKINRGINAARKKK